MRLRLRIATGALGMAGVLGMLAAPVGVAAATTSAATAATTSATTCTDGHWPASVQGVPTTFKAGARAGDYLWHDSHGWHLRVTHPGSYGVVFSGTIHASAPLDADPVKLESSDAFTVSADRKTITYRFVNYGRINGLDFKTSCARALTVRGSMSGHKLLPARIWLGHYGRHPLSNPFVIIRVH
jgi:hypothetical protein